MSDDAAIVWLDAGDAPIDAARALDAWARVRGVRLYVPAEPSASLALDPGTAGEQVERELDRAREAIGAADADVAERALARADALLREHPELPQAAWLRAEVERAWSVRYLRLAPRDEERARAAWALADALDGGREAGIGEARATSSPPVRSTLVVEAADPSRLTVRFDGAPLGPPSRDGAALVYTVDARPGEHAVVLLSGDRVAFAAWVALAGAAPTARLAAPDLTCARDELGRARRDGDLVLAPGVACPRWIAAARSGRPGGVRVARCERDRCGPLVEWRSVPLGALGPPQPIERARPLPAWLPWTLVGVGAAAATSIALVAAGAFDARPVETRFVVGGVRAAP